MLTIISAPLPVHLREAIFKGTLSEVSDAAVMDLITGYRWAFGLMLLTSIACLITSMAGRQARR